jgi:hypothetical protein
MICQTAQGSEILTPFFIVGFYALLYSILPFLHFFSSSFLSSTNCGGKHRSILSRFAGFTQSVVVGRALLSQSDAQIIH